MYVGGGGGGCLEKESRWVSPTNNTETVASIAGSTAWRADDSALFTLVVLTVQHPTYMYRHTTLDFCGRGGRGKSSKHSKTPCIQMKHGYSRTLFFSCTPRARVVSRVKKGYIPSYLAFVVVVVVVCMHLGYLFIPSPPLASSFSPHHLSIHPPPSVSIHPPYPLACFFSLWCSCPIFRLSTNNIKIPDMKRNIRRNKMEQKGNKSF